jgi:hypothetical protein
MTPHVHLWADDGCCRLWLVVAGRPTLPRPPLPGR